jgi:predicted metalloprotease
VRSTPVPPAAARRLLHSGEVMAGRWLAAGGVAAALVLVGCATGAGVATESAQRLEVPITQPTTEPPDTTELPAPTTEPPATTAPSAPTTEPGPASPPTTAPSPGTTAPVGDLAGQLDFGDAKTPRSYDDFLTKALTDIQRWWAGEFPKVYGKPFQPMRGKIYAGYPERTTEIPGCETRQPTTYEDIHQFSAFYCAQGDFMVYDDGPDGLLDQLAEQFGPSILGVVFAHEFGHAVQNRAGVLRNALPTITTEQQADCFAGAWVAHVANGGASGITFTDADVRSGLVAMIQVRDPKGIDQFTEGGHGSAFDRVGAFQVGFTDGAARCAELIDDPLPLVPNTFQPGDTGDGNAPYGYGDDEIVGLIAADLNDYWVRPDTGVTLPPFKVVPVQTADDIDCPQPFGDFRMGAVSCPTTGRVFLDEPLAKDLYGRFGDFVVGYILGGAWSEAAQVAMHSPLQGEQRLLVDDCMTGAWAKTVLPGDKSRPGHTDALISPGDLDEAIQAALVIGDDSSRDDVLGTGFEQIAEFRQGVLDGLDACTAQIGG